MIQVAALWTLRIGLLLLGVAALAIALSNFLLGVSVTADAFAVGLSFLGTKPGGFAALADPSVDAEFRFYSVFWGVYGGALIHVALRLPATLSLAPPLTLMFLLGGVGRLLSYLSVGAPDPLFVILMIVEFAHSALLLLCWLLLRPRAA